ncbi:MAG: phosphohistidine swiveling domain-containing protein [Myxococcota bacterium]|jgi:phosphohistidine swiveling domain-containing protein
MAKAQFGTKAETLERLSPLVDVARVLPQIRCTVAQWKRAPDSVISEVERSGFGDESLIVRSSALAEDRENESLAGHFLSLMNVRGADALHKAITEVVASYQTIEGDSGLDQVLVQPMLSDVAMSGVAFSFEPSTGSPYIVINYDDQTSSTSSVTGGEGAELKTFYWYRHAPSSVKIPEPLRNVIALMAELEGLLDEPRLDVEFAIDSDNQLYLLQVRPLTGTRESTVEVDALTRTLTLAERKIQQMAARHPYLHGDRAIYGVMPDWNPAEIIGVRPRPLALSLYRELITDTIWAYQRNNYGYRNLRSFPLLLSFGGLPYIDVRVSFNSFLPEDLEPELAERLVNYYIERLRKNPTDHDKVEFEIIYTCYTLDLPTRLERLREHGFSEADCHSLRDSLRRLTNRIIHGQTGLWRKDVGKIERLERRFEAILETELPPEAKLYWLVEDCKRYGTLPFAGLARAGFIAVQLLRSLVNVGHLDQPEYDSFMCSLETVSSAMTRDLTTLSRGEFLRVYGHLRPGTYDILSPRYDEAPDRYFDWDSVDDVAAPEHPVFQVALNKLHDIEAQLREHDLDHNVLGLFDFIKGAIEGREYAKFVFSRSLSEVLSLLSEVGASHGFTPEDCSYANVQTLLGLYATSDDLGEALGRMIEDGKRRFAVTRQLILPPLIAESNDVWAFELPPSEPNFVTQGTAVGPVARADGPKEALKGAILMIPSADPGFDWIFSHQIAGFITMYGGVNSHMAIRAAELDIPAVIGSGQTLFETWSSATTLEVDCVGRCVRVLR